MSTDLLLAAQLNNDPRWFEERGLNSLMILGFLFAGYSATGNSTYLEVADELWTSHQYELNVVNQRITAANDVNFSE